MKTVLISGTAAALAFWTGLTTGERTAERECQRAMNRFELRESGAVGVAFRLDKVTGEVVPVFHNAPLPAVLVR